jgi:hypothetical protein
MYNTDSCSGCFENSALKGTCSNGQCMATVTNCGGYQCEYMMTPLGLIVPYCPTACKCDCDCLCDRYGCYSCVVGRYGGLCQGQPDPAMHMCTTNTCP